MTKCGRYSGAVAFDYSPSTIRASITASLQRLKTTYVDTVYLHDVEYVCAPVAPKTVGNPTAALYSEKGVYGLGQGDEGKVWGEGDRKILNAIAELRRMKDEGLIKNIGISGRSCHSSICFFAFSFQHIGYPLATLLRIAILVRHTDPYKPLDVVLSYAHLTLQNSTFNVFATYFRTYAQVTQLLSASPLCMGLLASTSGPPPWHPAPKELLSVVSKARETSIMWPGQLANLALGFAVRNTGPCHGDVPLIVGFSNPREVHDCVKVWREIRDGVNDDERLKAEEVIRKVFAVSGFLDWSW
jgi:D-arabinose 1-dehydrogenase